MLKKRVIAVIIVCDGQVVQSVNFKHTNIVHYDVIHAVKVFADWSVDEIILLNVSRDIQSRMGFIDVLSEVSHQCFIPLTVGGWITDSEYAHRLLRAGADKLAVNTVLHSNPELVTSLSQRYGKQCIVASIDVKRDEVGTPWVHVDRGRLKLKFQALEWAKRAEQLGAGEILFNSIDHDGARRGYDIKTLEPLCQSLQIPVIGFGGVLTWAHMYKGIEVGCDAVAAANQFHYQEQSTRRAKSFLADKGVLVRKEGRIL